MRKEQAKLARKKIIEATESLIKEKGYDDILITDITSACDMSQGNFYNYFKSKEEVFKEIDSIKFYEIMNDLMPDADSPALSRLEAFVLGWMTVSIDYLGSNYGFYWARYYIRKSSPEGADESRINIIYGHLLRILEKGIKDNELREDTPVGCIAASMAFTIFGGTVHYAMTEDGDLLRRWAKDYCEIYIRNALKTYRVTQG